MASTIARLTPAQSQAADPDLSAWVSASAGSGKTQVLTARVLRLLLQGVPPEAILCITFTKAAAAEMATRLFNRLAGWARASDEAMAQELVALGQTPCDALSGRARTLFATTLDAPGGLRIQTLHAFAQELLASFPLEADIAPGFTTLDDRTASEAMHRTLDAEVTRALERNDHRFLADLERISLTAGQQKFFEIAEHLVRDYPAIAAFADKGGLEGLTLRLRHAFQLPIEEDETSWLIRHLTDAAINRPDLDRMVAAWRQSGPNDQKLADRLQPWLSLSLADRVARFDDLLRVFFVESHGNWQPRKNLFTKAALSVQPDMSALTEAAFSRVEEMWDKVKRFRLVDQAAAFLRFGYTIGRAMEAQKQRLGALGFDDLIRKAAQLLEHEGAAWVRYKIDLRIEHVLVDEAQDTNAHQWSIIGGVTSEFFAGEGAGKAQRSMFAVGDIKQAIFGFQGSDPATFGTAQQAYAQAVRGAGQRFEPVSLDQSFRSTAAVLKLVDAAIEQMGPDALGATGTIHPHIATRVDQPGCVTLWPALQATNGDGPEDEEADAASADQPWQPPAERVLAARIARQIADWLKQKTPLPARGRPMAAGDILILVRKRSELVTALVANLAQLGVPVAGVDRMTLGDPLVVQDLLALVRFALLPDDDLTCAELLKSPFLGWDDEALLGVAAGRSGTLWSALKTAAAQGDEKALYATERLGRVLALADWAPPYEFLEAALTELGGRRNALARFAPEARDPIEMALDAALTFQAAHPPSLQLFLDWIERSDIEVKRDPEAARDEVRIMTVHGAKGLQAPVVILADAYSSPVALSGMVKAELQAGMPPVPLWYGQKGWLSGLAQEAHTAATLRQNQEYARLLYVALTRAEDQLFIAGCKPRKNAGSTILPWYEGVAAAMGQVGAQTISDPLWGDGVQVFAVEGPALQKDKAHASDIAPALALPDWARQAPAREPRPPRPLSPSRLDDAGAPAAAPPAGAVAKAARRGVLLHRLLEQLPAVEKSARQTLAQRWLGRAAKDLTEDERAEIVATALTALAAPEVAALFGPDALAETPLSAVVGDHVIAGQADRLLVTPHEVLVVDIKTGPLVPSDAQAVPLAYMRQMAAYRMALGKIFPDRAIKAALFWTAGPKLMALPSDLLDTFQPFPVGEHYVS